MTTTDNVSDFMKALRKEFGGSNWVVHRRTRRIVKKYGEDVVCVSLKRYREVVDRLEAQQEQSK